MTEYFVEATCENGHESSVKITERRATETAPAETNITPTACPKCGAEWAEWHERPSRAELRADAKLMERLGK